MQAIMKNSFSSLNPTSMDVDGEIQFASESDSSPDTVNSPVIKARLFYSQKKKPATGYLDIAQNIKGRKESLHEQRNCRTVSDHSGGFHYSRRSRKREKRKSKLYLEKRQSSNIVKKIRKIAGINAGKLISDKFILKAENGKIPRINASPSPSLTPEKKASQSTNIILPNCDEVPSDFHRIVDCNGRENDDEEYSWNNTSSNRATLCCEKREESIIEDAIHESLETESEDEDVLLRYSSMANEEGYGDHSEERRDVERLDFLNSTWRNSSLEGSDVSNELLDLENNQHNSSVMCRRGSLESGSDLEVFDSSLCSIMDNSNKSLSKIDFAMEDESINPLIVAATDDGGIESTDIILGQDLEKLQSKNIDFISSNGREACKGPCRTLKCADTHNGHDNYHQIKDKSILDNRQSCSVNSHGLFKYFKKTPKESKGLLPSEEKRISSSQIDTLQKETGRTCVNISKRSPKHKSIFDCTEDATIENLSHLPDILTQRELIPSSSSIPNGVMHTRRSKKTSSSPKNGIKKLEQLYIDAGQKNFGHTTCPTCGMVYTKTLPDDVIQHSKYHHGIMQKLKFKGWKSERILSEFLDGRIIQVNPEDNLLHIKKVSELQEIVDKELGFVYGVSEYSDVEKVFLFISKKKIVGCAIAVPIKEAYPVVTPQNETNSEKHIGPAMSWCCSSKPVPALCGISRIWVLKQARRQQIASRLIDHVRRHFIYGVEIGKNKLAFSDPTPDGRQFAEKYSETPNFLVFR